MLNIINILFKICFLIIYFFTDTLAYAFNILALIIIIDVLKQIEEYIEEYFSWYANLNNKIYSPKYYNIITKITLFLSIIIVVIVIFELIRHSQW